MFPLSCKQTVCGVLVLSLKRRAKAPILLSLRTISRKSWKYKKENEQTWFGSPRCSAQLKVFWKGKQPHSEWTPVFSHLDRKQRGCQLPLDLHDRLWQGMDLPPQSRSGSVLKSSLTVRLNVFVCGELSSDILMGILSTVWVHSGPFPEDLACFIYTKFFFLCVYKGTSCCVKSKEITRDHIKS